MGDQAMKEQETSALYRDDCPACRARRESDRARLSSRVRAGLDHARSQGQRLGRRPVDVNMEILRLAYEANKTIPEIVSLLNCSRTTVFKLLRKLKAESIHETETQTSIPR